MTDWITDPIRDALLAFGRALLAGGVWAVNVAINFTGSFLNDPNKITHSWMLVRGLSLGLFGVAILVIAFMNLLRLQIQVWGVNRMIPKLFLAIFLVIFSKFVCISIINFATAVANTFTQLLSANSATPGDPSQFNSLFSGGMGIFSHTDNISISTAAAVLVFSFVAALVLLVLAIILFFRAVVLALLIVISPLAFSLTVLPWTQKYFQEWWKNFLKWTFFFPLCIIILTIGFTLIPAPAGPAPKTPYCDASGGPSNCTPRPPAPNGQHYCAVGEDTSNCVTFVGQCAAGQPPTDKAGNQVCVPSYQLDADTTAHDKESAASSFFGMIASMAVGLIAVILSVYLPLKMLGAFGAAAQGALKDLPGFKTGKRRYINPGTYQRMWAARGAKKKDAWAEEAEATLQGVGAKLTKLPGGKKLRSLATGIDTRSQLAYEDKQIKALEGAIKNPKAAGALGDYLMAKKFGDQRLVPQLKKEWEDMASDEEKERFNEIYNSLGSNRDNLLMKAIGDRGQVGVSAISGRYTLKDENGKAVKDSDGRNVIIESDHMKQAFNHAGVMKGDTIISEPLRTQYGSRGKGKSFEELDMEGVKGMKPGAWDLYLSHPDEKERAKAITQMRNMSYEDGLHWFKHSGAAKQSLDNIAEIMDSLGNKSAAAGLRGQTQTTEETHTGPGNFSGGAGI